MSVVTVELVERSYDVHVEAGAHSRAAAFLPRGMKPTRVFIITDANVAPLYAAAVKASFESAALPVTVSIIPAGEKEKNLARVEALYHEMTHAGVDRKSLVVALGGGVVGDIAGFAAATYMRGVAVMQIPTTIVAQVDSSIGGKTGVDLAEGKNLIGAFHQPAAVVTDPAVLSTLPEREVRAGLAEVIKHGVIRDAGYFARLEALGAGLLRLDAKTAEMVILRSVEIKAEIVSLDEKEHGLRAILNFGHTIGHALETVTGYDKYLHGEAVAVGMVAAANIAVAAGLCAPEAPRRISRLLEAVGLPTRAEGIRAHAIIDALALDKKAVSGRARFVLPREIGCVEIVSDVSSAQIDKGLVAAGFV